MNPCEYVLILQDWGGFISRRFGVRGVGQEAAVVIIDENAIIAGFYQGREPVEAVLRMLEGDSPVPSRGAVVNGVPVSLALSPSPSLIQTSNSGAG